MRLPIIVFAIISVLSTQPTFAQNANLTTIPEDIYQKHVDLGFAGSYGPAVETYTPLVEAMDRSGVSVTKDLQYGEDDRHLLDVYQPEEGTGLPVFVFIHGGGYTSGDRDVTPEFYSNIPTYFAKNGFLGISATYRLAPEAPWPAGGEDVGAVVAWIKDNAAQYGGDPERIFVMGHSAGATHVATYAYDSRFQPANGHGLSGVILISGRYEVLYDPDDPSLGGIRDYWGEDESLYASRSPINWIENSNVPTMLVVAEFDQPNLVATSGLMFAALCDRDGGRCPRFVQAKGHNHLSEVTHFGTADDTLGREVLDFMDEGADLRAEWSAAS